MRDELQHLPRDYLILLNDMTRDPVLADYLPAGAAEAISRALDGDVSGREGYDISLISYEDLCLNPRARRAELERRVDGSVDEWYAEPGNSAGRIHGLPRDDYVRIVETEKSALRAEIGAWRERHPETPYIQGSCGDGQSVRRRDVHN